MGILTCICILDRKEEEEEEKEEAGGGLTFVSDIGDDHFGVSRIAPEQVPL